MNKTIKILMVTVLALLCGFLFYQSFIGNFTNYGLSNNRFIALQDDITSFGHGSILFLGDSQVREDINCTSIAETTGKQCYNLGLAGIIPVQLGMITDQIVATQPDMVIFGLSEMFFNEEINKNDDFFFFIKNRSNIDPAIIKLLTQDELKLVDMTSFQKMLYKRKYLLPFYLELIPTLLKQDDVSRTIFRNYKDPKLFFTAQSQEDLSSKLNNETAIYFRYEDIKEREFKAFESILAELQQNKIQTKIIVMPLNPLLKEYLGEDTHEKFNTYLNELSTQFNCEIVEMQTSFEAEDFIDFTHLNQYSSRKYSQQIAELIQNGHE